MVMRSRAIDEFIHGVVKTFTCVEMVVRFFVEDAVSLISKAFQRLGQITTFDISALFSLAASRSVIHWFPLLDYRKDLKGVNERQINQLSTYLIGTGEGNLLQVLFHPLSQKSVVIRAGDPYISK